MASAKYRTTEIPRKRQAELLTLLGGKNAQRWTADGPQSLHRWLLVKALWRCVIPESDVWQKHWAKGHPVDSAITRLLAKGVSPEDLTLVVRQLQIQAMFDAVQVLDNASHGIEELQQKIPENVEWRVAAFDGEREEVGPRLGELHGTFLNLDPAGRMGEPPTTRAGAKKPPSAKKKTASKTAKRAAPKRR